METYFKTEKEGAATIITFQTPSLMKQGDLERIGVQLNNAVDEGSHRLVLDFSNVEFISSQAIGLLLATHKKLNQIHNAKLALCGLSPSLLQLLKITRLDKVLPMRDSRNAAVKAVS